MKGTKAISRYLIERLANLLFAYPTDSWEFASSVLLLLSGLWLILGTIFGNSELYVQLYMLRFAPPALTSGCILLGSGLLSFSGLFFGRMDIFRIIAGGISTCLWITVSYNLGKVDPWLLTVAVAGGLAFLSALSMIRLWMLRQHWIKIHPGEKPPRRVRMWGDVLFDPSFLPPEAPISHASDQR